MYYVLVFTLLCACASKKTASSERTGSSSPPVAVTAPADAAVATKKSKPATPAQLAEYRKHMKAGWAAQKQHKWADATTEFEAAVKVLDGDQRALSELGWSAMNAGDFKKARAADDEAVRVAIDPKVKAASLYNLGLVHARTGDVLHAAQSFRESIALRPNKTVEAELAKLGTGGLVLDTSTCAEGTPVCQCVYEEATEADDDWKERCKESTQVQPPKLSGFHVYDAQTHDGNGIFLTDEHDQIVTQIGGAEERMRASTAVTLDKMELRTVAGHKILWIETTDDMSSMYMSDTALDEGQNTAHLVTVCEVGDAKRPTRCQRGLIAASTISTDYSELDPDTYEPKGKPQTSTKTIENEVTLGDDGVVTVKLVKGSPDAWIQSMLGPHVLWR